MDFIELINKRASNDFYRLGINGSGYRPIQVFTGNSINGWFRTGSSIITGSSASSGIPYKSDNLPKDLTPTKYDPKTVGQELVRIYKSMAIEFPNLKEITLAQWMLESGSDLNSGLAMKANNFGGMKYSKNEIPFGAVPFDMRAKSEGGKNATWAKYPNIECFIRAYWARLNRPIYTKTGWRDVANDPIAYITAVAPVYAVDKRYIQLVLSKLPKAKKLLGGV